jgi:hypothetical protein
MSTASIYDTPQLRRPNAYPRPCAYCGGIVGGVVQPQGEFNDGIAFMLWDDRKGKNIWRAVHTKIRIEDMSSCEADFRRNGYKAAGASVPTGPVAAKQVAEAKDEQAELDRILAAPSPRRRRPCRTPTRCVSTSPTAWATKWRRSGRRQGATSTTSYPA